jgi:HSP20 family molecular chaperone IbpA
MGRGCARRFPLATAGREANIGAVGMPLGFRQSLRSKEGAMTTRVFASPLFLGFDHLEQILERASKTSSDGYPPYNIEQTAPNSLRITLAVAGFTMDDLQITQEDNQLVIRGRQNDDSQGRVFLHRGIAARQFQRAFVLAEGIEVKGAWLDNGLLHIDLIRPQPESRVKTIQITRTAGTNGNGQVKMVEGEPSQE